MEGNKSILINTAKYSVEARVFDVNKIKFYQYLLNCGSIRKHIVKWTKSKRPRRMYQDKYSKD